MFAEIEFAFGIDIETVVGGQTAFVEFTVNKSDFAVGRSVVKVDAVLERVVLIVALNLSEREARTEIPASAEFPLAFVACRVSQNDVNVVADCLARNKTAVDDFEITKNGFSASSHSGSRQVVFFSVPYEQGWSAKVNGKQANIIKSNVGFMSIITEPGDNQIEFVYKTPGLRAGFIISIVASFLLAIWCFVERRLYKVKK